MEPSLKQMKMDDGVKRGNERLRDVNEFGTLFLGFDVGNTPKIPDGVPPRFPKKPSIRQEGDNLIMECLLEAHPFPEITWYRGEKVDYKKKMLHLCC